MQLFGEGYFGRYDPSEDLSKIYFGTGCINQLTEVVSGLGTKVLLLTSPSILAQTDILGKIENALGSLLVGTYAEIKPHTPRGAVLDAVGFATHLQPDVIISLGGGSVTDTAKSLRLALWLGIRERKDFDRAFRSNKNNWQDLSPEQLATPLLPQVGMPTTLISAEPTQGMGITDDQGHGKQVFSHPHLKSVAIFLDPALSIRTPELLWLSSGVKAMEHAIAKLSALERNPVLDPIAAQAVAILSRDLIKSKANPDDLTARGNLLIASWLCMFGSWRTLITRMGLSHALGRQVGGVSGASHGLISAVLLPICMDFNAPAGGSGLLMEAQAFGLDLHGLIPEEAAIQSASKVRQIVQALELPSRLRDIGVDEEDLPKIAEKTMSDMSVATNPREIQDSEQVLELLQKAW